MSSGLNLTNTNNIIADSVSVPVDGVLTDIIDLIGGGGGGGVDAYTKTETDNLLDDKANQTTTYTKTETDNLLDDKANQTTTDASLANKQNLLSGTSDIDINHITCIGLSITGLFNALDVFGPSVFNSTVETKDKLTVNKPGSGTYLLRVGDAGSYMNMQNGGHHLDCWNIDNTGREFFINHFSNERVRCPVLNVYRDCSANQFLCNGAMFYGHDYGTYRSGVLSHDTGLQFAISANTPPASNELIMVMDNTMGVSITKFVDIQNSLGVLNDVSASSFTTTSDEKLKKNISLLDLNECEKIVKNIHPKSYQRTDIDIGTKLGYIAQDWENHTFHEYSTIVSNNSKNKTIEILPIVSVIHGALKSAFYKIEQLENKITRLENKITSLEAKKNNDKV